MKAKLAIAALGFVTATGLGIRSVAADTSVVGSSSTTVSAGTSGVCAAQTTLVQLNGADVVNRSDATCAP